jgi:type II secretory pathway component PulM
MRAIAEQPARSRTQAEQHRAHLLVAVLAAFSDATPRTRLVALGMCLGFAVCMALIMILWLPPKLFVCGGGFAWLIGRQFRR